MPDRTAALHCARAYIAQSRHFTDRHRGFSFVLLQWAAKARQRAAMAVPAQRDLFGVQ